MLAIREGISIIAPALAAGEWDAVASQAQKIQHSYILNQRLSADDAHELERLLPEEFKSLDGLFHARAAALAGAATQHNSDLSLHHYSRLLEACISCHSQFARSRFPDLAQVPSEHQHVHHK